MELSPAFWESQKGLLLVTTDGALHFTKAGRAEYAPLLARYGFALDNVTTLDRFREVMEPVNAGELAANTRQFEAYLNDPTLTPEERVIVRRVLGLDPAPALAAAPAGTAPAVG